MNIKQFFRSYFHFDKKDRLGAAIVLIIIFSNYSLPKFFPKKQPFSIHEDSTILAAIDTLKTKTPSNSEDDFHSVASFTHEKGEAGDFTKRKPFRFDPNTLDFEGWLQLGLSDRKVKTIINYRSKGGRFYKKEDLQKIWGLPAGFYEHVAAYIDLPSTYQNAAVKTGNESYPLKNKENFTKSVDINETDTASLIALPGIGSKLAMRIINFRDKLGGFYSIEQVGETYGVPDSTFQKIKPYLRVNAQQIRKININTATKDELKLHPYIKWPVANAIVEYRNQHGLYHHIADLKKITLIDERLFLKISPYCSL